MSARRDYFVAYKPLNTPKRVWLGDERSIAAVGIGSIRLSVSDDSHSPPLDILVPDVYHVPELGGNLLSVSALAARGHAVTFTKTGCEIRAPDGQTVGTETPSSDRPHPRIPRRRFRRR